MKIILAAFMLSVMLTAALAFGVGGDGAGDFGHMGALPNAGSGGAPLTPCGTGVIDLSSGCTLPVALGLVP